ncbi:hypothetical protein MRB53_040849 [Persea americana]|nr:hypothetical protein MRB53_040849 [Persea americana]
MRTTREQNYGTMVAVTMRVFALNWANLKGGQDSSSAGWTSLRGLGRGYARLSTRPRWRNQSEVVVVTDSVHARDANFPFNPTGRAGCSGCPFASSKGTSMPCRFLVSKQGHKAPPGSVCFQNPGHWTLVRFYEALLRQYRSSRRLISMSPPRLYVHR